MKKRNKIKKSAVSSNILSKFHMRHSFNTGPCCNFHDSTIKTDNFEDKLGNYKASMEKKMTQLGKKITVIIFDKELFLDMEKIEVFDDKINFNIDLPQINFASAWSPNRVEIYDSSEVMTIEGYQSIPTISYIQTDNLLHFRIDLFVNNFMRKTQVKLKIPTVTSYSDEEPMLVPEGEDEIVEEDSD